MENNNSSEVISDELFSALDLVRLIFTNDKKPFYNSAQFETFYDNLKKAQYLSYSSNNKNLIETMNRLKAKLLADITNYKHPLNPLNLFYSERCTLNDPYVKLLEQKKKVIESATSKEDLKKKMLDIINPDVMKKELQDAEDKAKLSPILEPTFGHDTSTLLSDYLTARTCDCIKLIQISDALAKSGE
jgi:hypothetical protein